MNYESILGASWPKTNGCVAGSTAEWCPWNPMATVCPGNTKSSCGALWLQVPGSIFQVQLIMVDNVKHLYSGFLKWVPHPILTILNRPWLIMVYCSSFCSTNMRFHVVWFQRSICWPYLEWLVEIVDGLLNKKDASHVINQPPYAS